MSRRLRYHVAVSLDGFIADVNGGYDWLVGDPAIDFRALYNEFDAAVMGRKTYELVESQGEAAAMPGIDAIAFSRTRPPKEHAGVRLTNDDPREVVKQLKAKRGKDIWLFGGGELFRSLLDANLVDTVEVAVMPVLLGSGIPLLPPGGSTKLVLADLKRLRGSGIVMLAYSVVGSAEPAPRIRYVNPSKNTPKKRVQKSKRSKRTVRK